MQVLQWATDAPSRVSGSSRNLPLRMSLMSAAEAGVSLLKGPSAGAQVLQGSVSDTTGSPC